MNKKYINNILLWAGLYLFWVIIFQSNTLTFSRTLGIQFCYLIFISWNYYFNIYFAIPEFLNRKKYLIFALVSMLFIICTSYLRAKTAFFINTNFYNISANEINFPNLFLNSLINIFVWSECLIAGKLFSDKIKFQRYTEKIEKEKIINELNFLRAQNDPHFLFNSLNSIYFQIDKTNKEAREMVMMLSEMLRYQLYECSVEKIPIDKEIKFLKNYIELQKYRLDKNFKVDFAVEPDVKYFSIAPLLLIPMIENAFKYVSHFSDKINEIKINLGKENDLFVCSICNTIEKIPDVPVTSEGGIGLKNLQRRLELLYPDRYDFNLNNDESYYFVKLILKTNENQLHYR
jgi:two-component system LytT family sensor kinase